MGRNGRYGRRNVWLHKIFNRWIRGDWCRISYSLWYCWRLCRETHSEKAFQKHRLIRIAARGGVHCENEKCDTIPRFSKAIQKSIHQLYCAGGDRCVFRTRPLLHRLSLVSQYTDAPFLSGNFPCCGLYAYGFILQLADAQRFTAISHKTAFLSTLSFALLALGLLSSSASPDTIGLPVTFFISETFPHTHTGNSFGHVHGFSRLLNVSFTILSSRE